MTDGQHEPHGPVEKALDHKPHPVMDCDVTADEQCGGCFVAAVSIAVWTCACSCVKPVRTLFVFMCVHAAVFIKLSLC